MNRTVEKFLKDIQNDFCWLLYSHEYVDTRIYSNIEDAPRFRAEFPFCCALASQIIASFLSAHFQKAQCFMTMKEPFNHSWCECQGEIIDYTYFQFTMDSEMRNKFQEYKVEKEELINFLNDISVIQEPKQHIKNDDWIERYEIELSTVGLAKNYSFSKEGFLQYAEDVFEIIQLETNYY